jgi:hypothetical protein
MQGWLAQHGAEELADITAAAANTISFLTVEEAADIGATNAPKSTPVGIWRMA